MPETREEGNCFLQSQSGQAIGFSNRGSLSGGDVIGVKHADAVTQRRQRAAASFGEFVLGEQSERILETQLSAGLHFRTVACMLARKVDQVKRVHGWLRFVGWCSLLHECIMEHAAVEGKRNDDNRVMGKRLDFAMMHAKGCDGAVSWRNMGGDRAPLVRSV